MENVKISKDQQRFSIEGEPVCCICGRYGEYICSITEADVCSLECKNNNLLKINLEVPPSAATNFENFLKPKLLNNIDYKPSKGELDLLPAVLYKNDVLLIAPNGIKRLLCLVVPLIQRITTTNNVTFNQKLLVLAQSCEECVMIQDLFKKYSKGLKNFRVASLANQRPLPCEIFRLRSEPCVVIATINRFLKISKIYPLVFSYLWIEELPKILKNFSSSKVSIS